MGVIFTGHGEGRITNSKLERTRARVLLKSDPFAFFSQHGIDTSSLVYDLDRYRGVTRSGWRAHGASRVAQRADEHLRGASRLMAAQADEGDAL